MRTSLGSQTAAKTAVIGLVLALAGCGASSASRGAASTTVGPRVAGQTQASRYEALRAHAQELEGRLALAEAETRDLRGQLRDAETESRRRTVRIGQGRGGAEEAARSAHFEDEAFTDTEVPVPPPPSTDRRPVLQLVGEPVRPLPVLPSSPLVLPPPPAGVETRLPIMPMAGADEPGRYARVLAARVAATPASQLPPLPQGPIPVTAGAFAPTPVAAAVDGATAEYGAALELVHARHLERALASLTVFIDSHPGHPHTEGARYWRGEVRYAQREYAAALTDFEELIRLAPSGRKTADALLKIGLCHQRMGDHARAHLLFQRLLRQFPETEAARTASRQDAS